MEPIPRRSALHLLGGAGLLGAVTPAEVAAEQAVAQATRTLPTPHITDISVIETAPAGVRLTVVKITDRNTQEVIRQIPPEEVLRLNRELDKLQGLLLRGQA